MKLTLTTNEGLVLAQYDIEEEFGDLRNPVPRTLLMAELTEEYTREKTNESMAQEAEEDSP